jgi:hypothetical protein
MPPLPVGPHLYRGGPHKRTMGPMRALRRRRCVWVVQDFSRAAHMSAMTPMQASALIVISPAERAAAGRQAIADCPEAFEELHGEGDRELVEHAAASDDNVNAALDTIGELNADEAPYLGKFLAEQLVEDAIQAEYRKQLGAYRAAPRTASDEEAAVAYEPTDPKHPGYLDRLGV